MKKKLFSLLFIFAALAMLTSACETIPDDNGAKVSINLDLLPRVASAGEVLPQGPGVTQYHVKITLTNPDETFYAFGWTPPEPISLMVAASGQRVIDVEVYEVSSGVSTNNFPAQHLTTWTPPAQRTLDLSSSEPQTVNLIVSYDSNYGDIGGGSEVLMSDGSTYIPLQFYRSCPPPNQFYADIVDLDWGGFKMFPTIPVDLAGGSYPTLKVYSLPAGHNFGLDVFHSTAGVWDRVSTMIPLGGMTPVDVKLGGYRDPVMTFDPAHPSVVIGNTMLPLAAGPASVSWDIRGGWGEVGSFWTGSDDTCFGGTGYKNYSFMPPPMTQCLIEVEATDCRGTPFTGKVNVSISGPCNRNGVCDDSMGEINAFCPADCYCGDTYCAIDEDYMTCPGDCGI